MITSMKGTWIVEEDKRYSLSLSAYNPMDMEEEDHFSCSQSKETPRVPNKIGDRITSDVVVRLRTHEGRDDWFYCHSEILILKSKYFADRLSENWPTCQILDSRNCVEVYCEEPDFNFHVSTLRLFYLPEPFSWHNVRNALGILRVAVYLGCHHMARSCTNYLESVPWEESDEEEILKTVPVLGSQYETILGRLQPVDPTAVIDIFISALRFATSSPPISMREMKVSAQEQLEYMLTEDDDKPILLLEDHGIRSEVRRSVGDLLVKFDYVLQYPEGSTKELVQSLLCDISWVCQILGKMEMMKDLVRYWVNASDNILKATESTDSGVKLKAVEVASKVLEAISYGNVVVPTLGRLRLVRMWLPFVQQTKVLADRIGDGNGSPAKMESEMWQSIESSMVSIVLTLPSVDQAEILDGWLGSKYPRYPDLTEAFEVWCYRSKVAQRRLSLGRVEE